jgi:phage terminase large subunit-like protein
MEQSTRQKLSRVNARGVQVMVNDVREERIKLGKMNFGYFFVYYFVDYVKYPFADFHFEMFQDLHDLMEGDLRELMWLMFRESAKTSIAKAFLVYLICHEKAEYINVDSYEKTNAERILFDVVLELQTNKRLIADFGSLYNTQRSPDEATQKRVSDFLTNRITREDGTIRKSVRVEAHSTQESVRGRLSGNARPDFLLMDDFETNRTKDSLAATESVKKHISEFYGGLAGNAKILYLGNYITEYGTIQALIDRSKEDTRLRVRNVPIARDVSLAQWPDSSMAGVPMWPEKYVMGDKEVMDTGKISIQDKRKQMHTDDRGDADFLAEMMNNPVDFTTQEFKREWFKSITMEDLGYKETALYITIDTAVKDKEGADDTGFAMNWVSKEGRWHVKTWGEHMNSKGLIDKIFSLWAMYKPIGVYIEETAFYTAIEPFLKIEMERRNEFPIVRPVTTQGRAKELRIRNLIPRYESNMIFHITGQNGKLEDQLLRFPKSKHDDVMDALAYQCDVARAPRERETKNRVYEQEAEQEEELLHPDIGI